MIEIKQKKKVYFNPDALAVLKKRYGYSLDYIRKSINGDRVGEMPDAIKKEYKQMDDAAKKAVQDSLKKQA